MTWVQQLHLELSRLGYRLPLLNVSVESDDPRYPVCDDSRWFSRLKTSHVGKVGYSSWDFAYDDWSGCVQRGNASYRSINGVSLRCGIGHDCEDTTAPASVRLSDVVTAASGADVVILSHWFNDHKGPTTDPPFKCFDGERIEKEDTARIAIPHIVKLVQAIRSVTNSTWIAIMREYPTTRDFRVQDEAVGWVDRLNSGVEAAITRQPRTIFVDYPMPSGVELYQRANYGHPNCRGSRLMAHGAVQALFRAKVIARALEPATDPEASVTDSNCSQLIGGTAECHSSAVCWTDPLEGVCKEYGVGSNEWYPLGEIRAMF
jgi:hypothetical protein